jgi:hypothetical protein
LSAADEFVGQGKIGYLSGDGPLPPRFEVQGWSVDKAGSLTFKGQPLLACPAVPKGSYVIWVFTGNPNPGGNENCLGITVKTVPIDKPVPCKYS